MSLKKINLRNGVLVLMMVFAAATRLINAGHLSEWSNFTPVGAIALFGGTYFSDKWKAYLVPMITLFASDIALDYIYFHKFMLFYDGAFPVYLSFALMVLIGSFIKKVNVLNVLTASLASVFVHWIITDIDPWLHGTLYAKSFYGYFESLTAALPFEKNMLLGNLVFGAILFGGFELAQRKYTFLRADKALAI